MTNVEPNELNYHYYEAEQYDQDIEAAIPFHRELHQRIATFLHNRLDPTQLYTLLDLGVGTGITAKLLRESAPLASIDVVDFSSKMLAGARQKLGDDERIRYIEGDYTTLTFDHSYDLIASVIGIHHQDAAGKQRLFQKIFDALEPGGTFIFGDLVTHRDPLVAARNVQLHEQHLIEHAANEQTLAEWLHHHRELNLLSPIEDQVDWLRAVGFAVHQDLLKFNTALLFCTKPKTGHE